MILIIGIPVNALAGYSLAKLNFPGKNSIRINNSSIYSTI